MEPLIFHVDVNSAYLSWEAARRVANGEPDIRLIPSAIGGDRQTRTGVILAKSIAAKKYQVQTGEPVALALCKCPQLYLAKPDFRLYEQNSRAFMNICRKYAPVVEKFSIEECFLDMSGTGQLYSDPRAIASRTKMKSVIRWALRLTSALVPTSFWPKWQVTLKSLTKSTPCFCRKSPKSSGRCDRVSFYRRARHGTAAGERWDFHHRRPGTCRCFLCAGSDWKKIGPTAACIRKRH